jgi:hypothetical protein
MLVLLVITGWQFTHACLVAAILLTTKLGGSSFVLCDRHKSNKNCIAIFIPVEPNRITPVLHWAGTFAR